MDILKIGIIGCGNMGKALASGILSDNKKKDIAVFLNDKIEDKARQLADDTGAKAMALSPLLEAVKILVITVKPQDFSELAGKIKEKTEPLDLLISVMAGVRMDRIAKELGRDVPIVRAMPNMPALINKSMTCYACNGLVKDAKNVVRVLKSIGEVMKVDEDDMDIVTAVSGSGPAYFYYLAGAMIESAVKKGFSRESAEKLVRETFVGAALLFENSGLNTDELISRIASKGGTTEAALERLKEKGFRGIIDEAITEAESRSCGLSRG